MGKRIPKVWMERAPGNSMPHPGSIPSRPRRPRRRSREVHATRTRNGPKDAVSTRMTLRGPSDGQSESCVTAVSVSVVP
jgi:hypothetical protein